MKSELVYGIKIKLDCADPTEVIRRDIDDDDGEARAEHHRIRDAIFAAKPDGFEVEWPHRHFPWTTDKSGFTFVPLYVTDVKNSLAQAWQFARDKQRELDRIKDFLKSI